MIENRTIEVDVSNLNLAQICDSGQCFRMKKLDNGYYEIIARDRRVEAWHPENSVNGLISSDDTTESNRDEATTHCNRHNDVARICFECSRDEYDGFWRSYFDIDTDTDYDHIKNLVDPKDEYLTKAVNTGYGIRILRQDLWEMIVTFLISQQNNIPRIHKCIDNICRAYGEHMEISGTDDYYAFPAPEALAVLSDDDLMPCNLGYRSKYVVRAAKSVAEGSLDLDTIRRLDYEEARNRLLQVYGIGAKVADCICLFALHHLDAFPVDTHIRQVLEREYAPGSGTEPDPRSGKSTGKKEIAGSGKSTGKTQIQSMFDFDRYRGYAGVIQQYIFYYELLCSQRS